MSARRWTRRSLLGMAGLATLTVAVRPWSATAATITVGGLIFDVPADVIPGGTSEVALGRGWQWTGRTSGATTPAAMAVLARADLAATDADEVLGLVLATSVTGRLPALVLDVARTRPMPGGGGQTRVDLAYGADATARCHGSLLIAIRPREPAALVAVLGNNSLSAGRIDAVLDSVRWLR
jgi:hypothetical protein